MDRAARRPVLQRRQRRARCGAGSGAPASAHSPVPRFGGTASDLAWLGAALAAHGFIAVAVNHPGNNGLEDSTVEDFSLMWLRAVDLSAVIDALLDDKTFGNQIDAARIGAAGHSLGGYTVIAVAGGITNPARIQAFCRSPAADALCAPPLKVSALRQKSSARQRSDLDFQQRYSKAANSYRDERCARFLHRESALSDHGELQIASLPDWRQGHHRSQTENILANCRTSFRLGSFASILARPLSRPLSATPDITTSDRDPSACRLPTPAQHRTGGAAPAPVHGVARSGDTRRTRGHQRFGVSTAMNLRRIGCRGAGLFFCPGAVGEG
jgi:hypothetical protein